MRAGKLRHRITLQAKTIGVDEYGGPAKTWTDVATNISASVEPLSGRELVNAQTVNAEITTKITMRYRAGVIAANRITHEGKFYNLQSVIDPELKHKELILMASEGLNEG
jgi:SPP1 family predicted phage head-tail adaptor